MLNISVGSFKGLQSVVLSNKVLEVTVLPQTGARIYSIFHKPTQTEFLWHHPHNVPRLTLAIETFDDVFPGGWDELFPTCEACEVEGLQVPDHGELWAVPWEWAIEKTVEGSEALFTGITAKQFPVRFERHITLDTRESTLYVKYRLKNVSLKPLNLIWGIHPLFNISSNHRLDLPLGDMLVGMSSAHDLGNIGQSYKWPFLPTPQGLRDMRRIPSIESCLSSGHYATQPRGNWFALTDTQKQVGIAMVYPQNIFRSLWVWQSYGEWRGLYHLAVEPWVGYPVKLDEAIQAGHSLFLEGQDSLEFNVSVFVYTGIKEVDDVVINRFIVHNGVKSDG